MNKKLMMLVPMVFLLVMAMPVVLAQTTLDADWDGIGGVHFDFTAGDDARSEFTSYSPNHLWGVFNCTDYDDNPYGYNVDTFDTRVDAHFEDGGVIEWQVDKTDNQASYGPAGQQSYSFITSDGTGDLKFKSWSNYASLQDCEYSYQSNDQFQATGEYEIFHSFNAGDDDGGRRPDGALVWSIGSGSSSITLMNSDTGWSGADKTSYRFGTGCGCYQNTDVTATGAGHFEISAWADNALTLGAGPVGSILGDGSDDSAQYTFSATYGAGFSYSGWWVEGN